MITRRAQTLCFDKGEFVVLEFNFVKRREEIWKKK